ncbi:alpha/beta hydrolase [Paludibacterium purpuratum]|uniref:Acetyl esterase n=1 Tax=Paludibacterium purpuratum TaxID=1144873 RepID=A0A4V3DV58_9NEIS|nr:alpha/beta hydrolase [Paludibacterium purpuratum]TDR79749.1 acetyl esterase [Paludibacterium purpuratum]
MLIRRAIALTQRLERALARRAMRLPAPLINLLAGPPIHMDGAMLDRQTQLALRLRRLTGKRAWHQLGVPAARRAMDWEGGLLAQSSPQHVAVSDETLPGPAGAIRIRRYRPTGLAQSAPTLVFYHGGGFVLGSIESHDLPCRALAAQTPCQVISVDYRLAPEHPFPAGVEDAIHAFRVLAGNAGQWGMDPRKIAVGGDSAGGNLSAVVSLATRHDAVRPGFQLLWYPAVENSGSFPSIRRFGKGFYLELDSMQWCLAHYTDDAQLRHPQVSPLFADLTGAPPAYIQTAGFDPLRDEGEAFAVMLAEAGVPTQCARQPGLIHGFLNMAGHIDAADAAFADAIAALRRHWNVQDDAASVRAPSVIASPTAA